MKIYLIVILSCTHLYFRVQRIPYLINNITARMAIQVEVEIHLFYNRKCKRIMDSFKFAKKKKIHLWFYQIENTDFVFVNDENECRYFSSNKLYFNSYI